MANLLTVFAGRRAKWVVAAIWVLAIVGSGAANLPGKFTDAEKNESTSFLPGDAESTTALTATKRFQNGDELAPLVIVYRREGGLSSADTRKVAHRPRGAQRAAAALDLAVLAAGVLERRHRGDRAGAGHRRRRGGDDPRSGGRGARARQRPGRRAGDEGHRARRLRGRPDQGLRGHQRRAAGGRAAARAHPARAHLPQPDLPLDPAAGDRLRGVRHPRARLRPDRGGRDRQRPVVGDPVDPRARRRHGLCVAARRALSRGAAPPRGQARGDGARAAHRGARRSSRRA